MHIEKSYVSHDTMVERMVGSTSSANNMHEVVDDNSIPYKNMVMDVIGMNWDYFGQYSIIDEEPNEKMTRFFDLLKVSDKPL